MMNPSQISSADIIDIVFDGRNKDYGAYRLRKFYPGRLGLSVGIVLFSCFAIMLMAGLPKSNKNGSFLVSPGDTLTLVNPKVDKPKPKEPPVQKPFRAQVRLTNPLIVKNDFFLDDTLPPVDAVQSAEISNITLAGDPTETGASGPNPIQDIDITQDPPGSSDPVIFEHPEIAAKFPGGPDAWRRYLERNLIYPEPALANEKQGTVKLQCVVDTQGNISSVTTLFDPGDGLAEEAIRIISKGPKWIPAEQDGEKVISRHIQTITFRLN
jgi:protein TonB